MYKLPDQKEHYRLTATQLSW